MGDSHGEGSMVAICNIEGCPGEYEERMLQHTARHQGQVIVIDHVPTEVCSECGDVLLRPETIRRLEELLTTTAQPSKTAPHYEFAAGSIRNDS